MLLLAGCTNVTDLALPPTNGQRSVIVAIEGDTRFLSAHELGDDPLALAQFSFDRDEDQLHLLQYEASLAALGLVEGIVEEQVDGAPLPEPGRIYEARFEPDAGWHEVADLPDSLALLRIERGPPPTPCAMFRRQRIDGVQDVVAIEPIDETRVIAVTDQQILELDVAALEMRVVYTQAGTPYSSAFTAADGALWLGHVEGTLTRFHEGTEQIVVTSTVREAIVSVSGPPTTPVDEVFLGVGPRIFRWTLDGGLEFVANTNAVLRDLVVMWIAPDEVLAASNEPCLRRYRSGEITEEACEFYFHAIAKTPSFGLVAGGHENRIGSLNPSALLQEASPGTWTLLERVRAPINNVDVLTILELDGALIYGSRNNIIGQYYPDYEGTCPLFFTGGGEAFHYGDGAVAGQTIVLRNDDGDVELFERMPSP